MKITRKGYYTITGPDGDLLWRDDKLLRVTSRDEAYEQITEDGRGGTFTIKCPDREVDVVLLAASDLISVDPPNLPPEWTSTPSPAFIAGVAGSYDLSQHTSDPEADALTFTSEGTALPIGVTISGNNLVATDATSEATTNGIIIGADDGTNSVVNSSSFNLPVSGESSAVIHADLGTTLGVVPTDYIGYQLIRTVAAQINVATNMSFDVDQGCTIVYLHISDNDHDTYKPSWLTAGNGWSNSGNTGTISMPDSLTASGMRNVTGDYFENTIGAGTFTYAGFRSATWDEALGHFVGAFLIPNGVTVTNIIPETYELIPDVSAAYTAPARDELYWDVTPPSVYGAADNVTATTWAEFHTDIEAATAGQEIEIADATYTDDGLITINDLSGTAANPIIIRPETPGGAVISGTTRIEFSNCEYLIFEGFDLNALDGGNFARGYDVNTDCKWIVARNCKLRNLNTVTTNNFGFRVQGQYCRLHNIDTADITERFQAFYFQAMIEPSYPRVDHNDLVDHINGASSGSAEAIQCGNNASIVGPAPAVHNGLCDHNRIKNWNKPGESEAVGMKATGWALVHNLFEDSNGDLSPRNAADYLIGFNRFVNITNKNNRNRCGSINATNEDRTDGVHCLNVTDYTSDPNGWWQVFRVDSNHANRRAANRVLFVGDMAWDGNDVAFRTATVGTVNLAFASDLRWEGCTVKTANGNFMHVTDHAVQGDWTFSGCVMKSVFADPNAPLAGNTEADPDFQDRGDGIKIPQHVNMDFGINTCFPGRLEGGAIANLGTTW